MHCLYRLTLEATHRGRLGAEISPQPVHSASSVRHCRLGSVLSPFELSNRSVFKTLRLIERSSTQPVAVCAARSGAPGRIAGIRKKCVPARVLTRWTTLFFTDSKKSVKKCGSCGNRTRVSLIRKKNVSKNVDHAGFEPVFH